MTSHTAHLLSFLSFPMGRRRDPYALHTSRCAPLPACRVANSWTESAALRARFVLAFHAASDDSRRAVADGVKGAHTVIVGAGAAGCVLASRLTEQGTDVLVLEPGPDYGAHSLPTDLDDGTRNSYRKHDWKLRHRPTLEQFRFPLPRGRVVGGSSAVNTCIALRGLPGDYDEWASLGLPEWSWETCLPAFKRLERDWDFGEADYHGDNGPLPIRRHRDSELTPWQAAFREACSARGYLDCADHNRPHAVGAGPTPLNHIDGHRVSAARAWLTPEVRARPRFELLSGAHVVRVRFSANRAVGLDVLLAGKSVVVNAERVFLCAGAIHTPGILLRSGIARAQQLKQLGVPVVVDAPVGARLLDHPGLAFFLRPRRRGVARMQAPLMQSMLRLGSRYDTHDGALLIQPGSFFATPYADMPMVSLMVVVERPQGTGRLSWPSAHPLARPDIESRFLIEPRDLDQAVEGFARALELAHHPSLSALATPLIPTNRVLSDEKRLRRWAPLLCDSGYHPCGTVPMGPESADWAVCDGRGQIRGVEGLYVADASLFPTIPSANIHVPTLMVAERIAEMAAAA